MGRAPCCDKASVKKGPWSPEEDAKLKDYIHTHGTGGNWIALPHKAGLKRCGKSCRLRWLNYLRPNIKHGEFSDDEDRKICTLFATIGSRWSIIAAQLPGRTDNDIKNYWNTKLKKKLLGNWAPPMPAKSQKLPTFPFGSSTDFSLQNPLLASSSFPYSPQIHSSYPSRFVGTQIRGFPTPYHPSFCAAQIHSNSGGSDGFLCPNLTQAYQNSSCSSSDGSSCVINAAQDFTFDGYSSNGREATRTPLDHSIEEIKQLITTTNSNLNFFVMDEVKTEDQLVFDSDC